MKLQYQDEIESLSNIQLFNYLTKDRHNYSSDYISNVQLVFEQRKLNYKNQQSKSNQSDEEIIEEIKNRINNYENVDLIKSQFILRNLNEKIIIIEKVNEDFQLKQNKNRNKSKTIFNYHCCPIKKKPNKWLLN